MKKIFLLISFVFLFADIDFKNILDKVDKNSPEYSLDMTLIKEIKSLKPKKK